MISGNAVTLMLSPITAPKAPPRKTTAPPISTLADDAERLGKTLVKGLLEQVISSAKQNPATGLARATLRPGHFLPCGQTAAGSSVALGAWLLCQLPELVDGMGKPNRRQAKEAGAADTVRQSETGAEPVGKTETPAGEAKADSKPARLIHEPVADESIMILKNQKKKKNVTKPTGQLGGQVMGEHPKHLPEPNKGPLASEKNRGITRENESAEALADSGNKVEHRPKKHGVDNASNPDYRIEGRLFECYSPNIDKMGRIMEYIRRKSGQADRLVVNLTDTKQTADSLRRQLDDNPIPGLKEVIAVDKSGRIRHVYP